MRLAEHRAPDAPHLRLRLAKRELGAEAGDGLELVERAAGVTQCPPGHHRHGDADRGHQGREQERRLVAHAAGGVLVDPRHREPVPAQPVAGVEHGVGQRRQLGRLEPAEHHRHRQGGHLVVRHLAEGERLDQRAPFLRRQRAAVSLALDEWRNHHSALLDPIAVFPMEIPWMRPAGLLALLLLLPGIAGAQTEAADMARGNAARLALDPPAALAAYTAAIAAGLHERHRLLEGGADAARHGQAHARFRAQRRRVIRMYDRAEVLAQRAVVLEPKSADA